MEFFLPLMAASVLTVASAQSYFLETACDKSFTRGFPLNACTVSIDMHSTFINGITYDAIVHEANISLIYYNYLQPPCFGTKIGPNLLAVYDKQCGALTAITGEVVSSFPAVTNGYRKIAYELLTSSEYSHPVHFYPIDSTGIRTVLLKKKLIFLSILSINASLSQMGDTEALGAMLMEPRPLHLTRIILVKLLLDHLTK